MAISARIDLAAAERQGFRKRGRYGKNDPQQLIHLACKLKSHLGLTYGGVVRWGAALPIDWNNFSLTYDLHSSPVRGYVMRLTAVLRPSATIEGSYPADANEASQRRSSQRRSLKLSAVAGTPSLDEAQVLIRDISPGGLLIETEALTLAIDDNVEIQLPDRGIANARVVWASGPFFGCEFSDSISVGAVSAALLKANPQSLAEEPASVEDGATKVAGSRIRFEPKINLSAALFISFGLWALVGLGAYLLTR